MLPAGQRMMESSDNFTRLGPTGARCSRCDFALADGRCWCCDPPEQVDNYRIERVLGRGGLGVVFLGVDPWLDRQVALKMMRPDVNSRSTQLLIQEARALAAVRSSHVAQVYAFGCHETAFFFAMEHVDGMSLDTIIAAHRADGQCVPLYRSLAIIREIANGLDAVHSRELLHRDVKPGNIVIERDTGRSVLIDFGLAIGDGVRDNTAGSPHYMAPEQWRGEALDPRCDVYGLACCAFELLTGYVAFPGSEVGEVARRHCQGARPRLAGYDLSLDPFDEAIHAGLARALDQRIPRCRDFAARLTKIADDYELLQVTPPVSIGQADELNEEALRVLVVEPDRDTGKVAARAVQLAFFRKNIRVKTVRSGAAALAVARRTMPSLVLIDWEGADSDALGTLARLRAMAGGGELRAIVLCDAELSLPRLGVLGVHDVVSKAADIHILVDTILALAKRAGWRSMLAEA